MWEKCCEEGNGEADSSSTSSHVVRVQKMKKNKDSSRVRRGFEEKFLEVRLTVETFSLRPNLPIHLYFACFFFFFVSELPDTNKQQHEQHFSNVSGESLASTGK